MGGATIVPTIPPAGILCAGVRAAALNDVFDPQGCEESCTRACGQRR